MGVTAHSSNGDKLEATAHSSDGGTLEATAHSSDVCGLEGQCILFMVESRKESTLRWWCRSEGKALDRC